MARRKGRSRNGGGSWFGKAMAFLMLLAVAGAAAAGYFLVVPFGPEEERFVELPAHSSSFRMGQILEHEGIIRSQFAFDLLRWVKKGRLKAGEYRFDHPVTALEVYSRIARGDVYTRTVVVPEGSSIFEIATRMEQAGLGSRQAFLDAAVNERELIADLDPNAGSLEGYLFPDTYHFPRKFGPHEVYGAMVRRFRQQAAEIGLTHKFHETVTMASLVERETAVAEERPLVASVFVNRLGKKMPLMTDPAVIYGLEMAGRWRGTIYQSDLKTDTPYNTYLHAGLPPGPIANPGAKSLKAAMHPADSGYYYFVAAGANPQGRSLFAATLEEHTKNVAGYRAAMKNSGGR